MPRAKDKSGAKVIPLYRPRKCPICGKPSVRAFHPFDSKRCADLDLSKWLTGSYAIPSADPVPETDSENDDGET
ncbi:MAG: DNA gyrase inhibitor YacG [Bauldia sp.]